MLASYIQIKHLICDTGTARNTSLMKDQKKKKKDCICGVRCSYAMALSFTWAFFLKSWPLSQ